jgi:ADA HAT complex component 1
MLRLLSWSSGLAADRIIPQEVNYLAPSRHRSPSLDLQKPPMLKRKRVDSPGGDLSQKTNKRRLGNKSQVFAPVSQSAPLMPPPMSPPAILQVPARSSPEVKPSDTGQTEDIKVSSIRKTETRTKPDLETLRQTLNSQISLEILLKHKELRLIDQEIAKCQIALEQLRRCSEIPYPMIGLSQAVSQGQGPAVRSSRSAPQAESPAPWGVADGPYTRHYAKWLLPDPLFDGGEAPVRSGLKVPASKTPTKGRATRGSFAESTTGAGKSKAQRVGKFQALSSGYPQPKDKAGPMIAKRKSDSALVKLICLDCRRDNFSSTQGFINHCRIAHGRNFSSHDAAAEACGEPVDVDEAGLVVGGDGPPSATAAGLVHPLIYSAHLIQRDAPKKVGSPDVKSEEHNSTPRKPLEAQPTKTSHSTPDSRLTPSSFTPNLSTLLSRRGADMDLQNLVAEMKTPVPNEGPSDSEAEEEEDSPIPEAPAPGRHPHVTGVMQPARSTISSVSPNSSLGSRKGLDQPRPLQTRGVHLPYPSSARAPPTHIAPSSFALNMHSDALEPSPTNDSNQAPSLVDDDGDDEFEAHSPSYSGSESTDIENRDLDFEVEDGDESGPSTRNPSNGSEFSGTPKIHPASASARRASAFRRSINGREEKHVTFVDPNQPPGSGSSKKGGDRKRRRAGRGQ